MCGNVLDTSTVADIESVSDFPERPSHSSALLVDPLYYDREYRINPYMSGDVDRERARKQWERLRAAYDRHADRVRVLCPDDVRNAMDDDAMPAPETCPDMVFIANHALPTADGDGFVLARMATDERKPEPGYFAAWASGEGYEVRPAPAAQFEGMGDAIWHPERELLWGGYGVRTEREAYDELASRLDVDIVPIELTDEHHYHLDVCMAPLSETAVLIQPDAFTPRGRRKIDRLFDVVLEVPADASRDRLSVNIEVINGTVVAGDGCEKTVATLENAGYDVVTVPTGEYLKAGGSVCCLTLFAGSPG